VPVESKQHTASLHLSTLGPLLDLVADLPDEGLLRSLAVPKSHVENHNAPLVATNAMHLGELSPETRRDLIELVKARYAEVGRLASGVQEVISIRL
jgi:hypothetical protein